jgi:hypothetical protein
LDKIVDNNTASKCMVQIGSRTNIYHKIGQNYRHNSAASKCMVQIGSLGPTFIIKLDKTIDNNIESKCMFQIVSMTTNSLNWAPINR